eukprot:tig00000262_g23087.t1
MGSAFSEHGGEEAICMVMAEGLDPKACSEEELKMRSGDAYSATSRTFPQLENRMLEFFARVVLIPLDHKPAKKRTYLHSDIRENELPALMVAPSPSRGRSSTRSPTARPPASSLRAGVAAGAAPRLLAGDGLCPLTRFIIAHCAVDPTTYVAAPNTEGYMTSVAASSSTSRARRAPTPPPPSAPTSRTAAGRDPRRLRLLVPPLLLQARRRLADLHPRHRPKAPLSLGESQPALEAIAIPVAQFKDPAPDVGPSSSSPTPRQGQAHPQLGAGLPPAQPPPRPPSSAPASSASTRCCRARSGPRTPAFPPVPPSPAPLLIQGQGTPTNGGAGPSGYGSSASSASATAPAPSRPGAVLTAIQASGPSRRRAAALAARQAREAEERRQALWASACRPPSPPRRAGLRLPRRPDRRGGGSERWRAFEAESAGLAKGLGYSYRRARAQGLRAAREEAEDNARFRHLHH